LLPFFPLASGLLTGKYHRGESAPTGTRLAGLPDRLAAADWDTIERIEAYAAQRDLRPIDVAIGGLAAQPAVASVIAGATRPEQVVENVQAGLWQPTAEDLAELDEITAPPA
jgi:aryl-alcohol dehydrogenase-like predicted oxidoreductase